MNPKHLLFALTLLLLPNKADALLFGLFEALLGWIFCPLFGLFCPEEQPCDPNPCKHGTCSVEAEAYRCACDEGWEGGDCSTDKNECTLATDSCNTDTQVCENTEGSFQCIDCFPDLTNAGCDCGPGFERNSTGFCMDEDECAKGTANCNPDSQACENRQGSFTCIDCLPDSTHPGCFCEQGYSRNSTGVCVDDLPPLLTLLGIDTYNPLFTYSCVKIDNAEFGPDVTLAINEDPMDPSSLSLEDKMVCANVTYMDGANTFRLTGTTTTGRPLELLEVIYAGEQSLSVDLVTPSGELFLGFTSITAALSDSSFVRETKSTDTGTLVFENLPSRTILLTAIGPNNEAGSAGVAAGISNSVEITMMGFVNVSATANGDFSQGLEGWIETGSSGAASVQAHVEEVGPTTIGNTAGDFRLLRQRSLAVNNDLSLSTIGQGESLISHSFQTSNPNSLLHVRYRFVTSEVPGGYFGSQFNDYFRISLRSVIGGDFVTAGDSMNNLGLAAFDSFGSTAWFDLFLVISDTGFDTVQVDVAVANVADALFGSIVIVDFVNECEGPSAWEQALMEADTFGKKEGGIPASQLSAKKHSQYITPELRERFELVADEYDVPLAVIAGLASRESNMGSILGAPVNSDPGWGDNNNAFGILQVDRNYHEIQGIDEGPTSLEHIRQAIGIYSSYRDQVASNHPDWAQEDVLKGAAVAYNSGVNNVQTIESMDLGTTGNDYGSDVMARAQWYYLNLENDSLNCE